MVVLDHTETHQPPAKTQHFIELLRERLRQ